MKLVCTTHSKMKFTAISPIATASVEVNEIGTGGSTTIGMGEDTWVGAIKWTATIDPKNFVYHPDIDEYRNVVTSIEVLMPIAPPTKTPATPAEMTIKGDTQYTFVGNVSTAGGDVKPLREGNTATGVGTYSGPVEFTGTATITNVMQTSTWAE